MSAKWDDRPVSTKWDERPVATKWDDLPPRGLLGSSEIRRVVLLSSEARYDFRNKVGTVDGRYSGKRFSGGQGYR